MKQALVLLFALFIFSESPLARADDMAATAGSNAATSSPVEKRITELHTKLKITSDQETLWTPIATQMRSDADSFGTAIKTREGKATSMTAIDDLNSYADLAAMHADSMKKFIATFSPLYAAMTPDQKKNADSVFQEHKKSKKRMSKS